MGKETLFKTSQRQLREVTRIQNSASTIYGDRHTGDILCICQRRVPIINMFRCYHCGLWLCPICAKEHFGERKNVPGHKV